MLEAWLVSIYEERRNGWRIQSAQALRCFDGNIKIESNLKLSNLTFVILAANMLNKSLKDQHFIDQF